MTVYKDCFIASEAIDSILFAGLASTREEAVQVGLTLQDDFRVIKHVTVSGVMLPFSWVTYFKTFGNRLLTLFPIYTAP